MPIHLITFQLVVPPHVLVQRSHHNHRHHPSKEYDYQQLCSSVALWQFSQVIYILLKDLL